MAQVNFGGDPEEYMDPPRMSTGSNKGSGNGVNPINAILEFLGIHRNVGRSLKPLKVKTKGLLNDDAVTSGAANSFLDETGAALAREDLANTRPLQSIDLPPSIFGS